VCVCSGLYGPHGRQLQLCEQAAEGVADDGLAPRLVDQAKHMLRPIELCPIALAPPNIRDSVGDWAPGVQRTQLLLHVAAHGLGAVQLGQLEDGGRPQAAGRLRPMQWNRATRDHKRSVRAQPRHHLPIRPKPKHTASVQAVNTMNIVMTQVHTNAVVANRAPNMHRGRERHTHRYTVEDAHKNNADLLCLDKVGDGTGSICTPPLVAHACTKTAATRKQSVRHWHPIRDLGRRHW
jgi:hypothetical protein